ncbi:hypothetical protein Tco_1370687 [Tanacetum coccineum]
MGNVKKSIDERTRHQRRYDRRVNKRQMQTQESKVDTGRALDVGLVVTKSSGTVTEVQDESKSALAKPYHVIASSESRNSSKDMLRFSSNDMIHNHYLEKAQNKTQEKDRNSKTIVMPSARLQNTANDSKPKPRSTNQMTGNWPTSKSSCVAIIVVPKIEQSRISGSFSDSKHVVCLTYQKCIFNANHDTCTTFLKEVNSHATVQSYKTRNSNKPVEQKSHTQKPVRQIFTGHRFSPNKSSAVYEKMSPRSCLRWKSTGRIFKTIGLRWVPTGKPRTTTSTEVPTTDMIVMTLIIELESLFDPLFDDYFNEENQVVSKSFVVTTVDASDKRQQQFDSTSSTLTLGPIVSADGNFDLWLRLGIGLMIQPELEGSTHGYSIVKLEVLRDASKLGESNASALEDLTLRAGNPVKDVLIMNLPDHSRWHYYLTPASSMPHAHSASKQKKNVSGQKAQVHVIILLRNSDNHELHQRSSKSNKNCLIGEIVSLDEEDDIVSFQASMSMSVKSTR